MRKIKQKEKTISEHREKKNAAILAELGARVPTIRALTKKEPATNYRVKKETGNETSKSLKRNATSSCPADVMKATEFIKIFNNLNKKIGRNYSRSERFIKAYLTYLDCLESVNPLNINTCYRVLKDTIKSNWFTENCGECRDEFATITAELLCPSCSKVKQISCSRCGRANDRYKSQKTRGHPHTVCTPCKDESLIKKQK